MPESALKVLYRLRKAGYQSFLVGGGVRDLLLGLSPKDFDVATDATPEQVHKLFRNSRLIGRRFKLVHVVFGREVIEVATFRASPQKSDSKRVAARDDQGMIVRDNVYGSIDEDAMRRDLTINALYYNIDDFSVHAYAGAWQDLQKKNLRMIGDPEQRYREDPVRMLRVVRFAVKLQFAIDSDTSEPIPHMAALLGQVPAARLFEEVLKLLLHGHGLETLRLLRQFDLFRYLFPTTDLLMDQDDLVLQLIEQAMCNTDQRIAIGKSVTPYFFLAVFLWPQVSRVMRDYQDQGLPPFQAMQRAADRCIVEQSKFTSIPKRLSQPMKEIWELQLRLPNIQSKKALDLLAHPRFRAAYDFVLLREQIGEDLNGIGQWWTDIQVKHPIPERKPERRRDNRKGKPRGNHAQDTTFNNDDENRPKRRPRRRRSKS